MKEEEKARYRSFITPCSDVDFEKVVKSFRKRFNNNRTKMKQFLEGECFTLRPASCSTLTHFNIIAKDPVLRANLLCELNISI